MNIISTNLMVFSLALSAVIVLAVGVLGTGLQALCKAYADALRKRFVKVGYVRFHLLIGGVLTLMFLSWFGEAAELAFRDGSAQQIDQEFATALHLGATPTTVALFGVITNFGGSVATIVLGVVVAAILLYRKKRTEQVLLFPWCIGLIGGAIGNRALKEIFRRPRPVFDNPYLVEPYFSFPSGHAMGSVVLYGLLAYIAFVLAPTRYRMFATALALLLGTLIGLSRLVLGVHFLSDVLAGWIVGAVWVTWMVICTQVARFLRYGSERTES